MNDIAVLRKYIDESMRKHKVAHDDKTGHVNLQGHRFQLCQISRGYKVTCNICGRGIPGPQTCYAYKSPAYNEDSEFAPPFYCINCVGKKAERIKLEIEQNAWFENRGE